MKILALSKYPPIQGGTASRCYFNYRLLAEAGHRILVVTNAAEVEAEYRCRLLPGDEERLVASFPSGGEVRVVFTDRDSVEGQFVPAGDATVTRLAALALQAYEAFSPDVMFCSYLEPYGMAAALVSAWTGLPYVLEHAGSDRTRLLANPELGPALARVVRGAAVCFSGDRTLVGFGLEPDRLATVLPSYLPSDLFSPTGPTLTVDRSVGAFADDVPSGGPIVGIYGKVGITKGSFDLLAALDTLRRDDVEFELRAMVGGRALEAFERRLVEGPVGAVTSRVPFLCPWQVPAFLRSCDVVCFLEREFPVRIHGPKVAREVLATGRCLVVSEEIRRKQRHAERFADGENVVIVPDPRRTADLANLLRRPIVDPGWAAAVGRAGHELFEPTDPGVVVTGYENAFTRAAGGRSRATPSPRPPLATSGCRDEILTGDYPASHAILTCATLVSSELVSVDDVDMLLLRGADDLPPDSPPWWRDVLRYDAARAWLRRAPTWRLPTREVGAGPDSAVGTGPQDFYPEVTAPVKVLSFEVDVPEVEQALRSGAHPRQVSPDAEPTTLLFVKSGDLLGGVYRLSSSAAAVIPAIDGVSSIEQICRRAKVGPEQLASLLQAFEAENALRVHTTAPSDRPWPVPAA